MKRKLLRNFGAERLAVPGRQLKTILKWIDVGITITFTVAVTAALLEHTDVAWTAFWCGTGLSALGVLVFLLQRLVMATVGKPTSRT